MTTQMFVNLPVKDLDKSVEFFKKLGFEFNPRFTDENATCMIVGEDNFVMLIVEKFFKTFTPNEIGDSHKNTEVIVTLSADSRSKVDSMVDMALMAGAKANGKMDQDGMYERGFQDLDGHLWEFMFMDMSAMPS